MPRYPVPVPGLPLLAWPGPEVEPGPGPGAAPGPGPEERQGPGFSRGFSQASFNELK